MDENLKRIAGALRREYCPPRVLAAVERRALKSRPRLKRRAAAVSFAIAGAALLGGLASLWRTNSEWNDRRSRITAAASHHAQVAREAEDALGFIGAVLREAGSRSESAIFKGAMPPLRDGLEKAKNKTIDRIEL